MSGLGDDCAPQARGLLSPAWPLRGQPTPALWGSWPWESAGPPVAGAGGGDSPVLSPVRVESPGSAGRGSRAACAPSRGVCPFPWARPGAQVTAAPEQGSPGSPLDQAGLRPPQDRTPASAPSAATAPTAPPAPTAQGWGPSVLVPALFSSLPSRTPGPPQVTPVPPNFLMLVPQ